MEDPEKRPRQEGRKRLKKAIYQRNPDKPDQAPRKPKELKHSRSLTVRFTKSEWDLIAKNAELAGTTPTAVVRAGALGLSVRAIVARAWSDAERATYKALVGGMNNLNQLTKATHLGATLQAEATTLFTSLRRLLAELVPAQKIEQNQELS
ncbi:MAG: plasmid mobilization protein [Janthinobacterium lividum]